MCVLHVVCVPVTMCTFLFGLRESPAVCVVCWLRAKHHVRVCVSASINMCMFLAARERKSVRQSSRSSAKTNVNHMKSAVVDIVLGSPDAVTSMSWTRPCLRPSNNQTPRYSSEKVQKRCSLGVTLQNFCLVDAAAAASFDYCGRLRP